MALLPLTRRTASPGTGPEAAPAAGHLRAHQHVRQAAKAIQEARPARQDSIARPVSPTAKPQRVIDPARDVLKRKKEK